MGNNVKKSYYFGNLPFDFVKALLMPVTRNSKEVISPIQRCGLHNLFHVNILRDITEFYFEKEYFKDVKQIQRKTIISPQITSMVNIGNNKIAIGTSHWSNITVYSLDDHNFKRSHIFSPQFAIISKLFYADGKIFVLNHDIINVYKDFQYEKTIYIKIKENNYIIKDFVVSSQKEIIILDNTNNLYFLNMNSKITDKITPLAKNGYKALSLCINKEDLLFTLNLNYDFFNSINILFNKQIVKEIIIDNNISIFCNMKLSRNEQYIIITMPLYIIIINISSGKIDYRYEIETQPNICITDDNNILSYNTLDHQITEIFCGEKN